MAERRMFAKTIIDSDAFMDMPMSSQMLYFHLAMRADDDGFINNPKKIQRMIGASDDDAGILVAKRFVLTFESGVIVIKHWRMHNYLRSDRYKETVYADEKAQLDVKDNGAYTFKDGFGIPDGYQLATQVRLGKVRLGKVKEECPKASAFVPPTLEEVTAYCTERGNTIDPEAFIAYYQARGWMLSNWRKMKAWQPAVITWEKHEKARASPVAYPKRELKEHETKEYYDWYWALPVEARYDHKGVKKPTWKPGG